MSRKLAHLISTYSDLSDRYGADDPLVLALRGDVERRQVQTETLPFADRRKVNLAPPLWQRRLRQQTRMHRGRGAAA